MSSSTPNLVLYNANVITLDASMPRASWVAASRGTIAGVGLGHPPRDLMGLATRAIDCQGGTLAPGFHDAHCHVLAAAAYLLAVDCSPAAVSSIEEIKERIRERAADAPPGAWIRGVGYNDFYLREKRHPTRWDLDAAVSDRPVRLTHRSGHAVALNSRALTLAAIGRDMPDPPIGVIERDGITGEPTGLLLEMDGYLEGVVPRLSTQEVHAGLRRFNEQCLALGITSLQDATPGNSVERWRLFEGIKERGLLTPSLTLMAGAAHLQGFLQEGFAFGHSSHGMRLGAAKVVATMTTGSLRPSREVLHRMVGDAHRSGFQVAIHAVEMEAVEAAVEAIGSVPQEAGSLLRHRIEHCSECPPHLADRLGRLGITVVTQPGFIYYSGERYLAEVDADRLPWLYPIGSLKARGVVVAAGSDAPVAPLAPLMGIYAAATRRAESGDPVLSSEAVSVEDAMQMYTLDSAYACFNELVIGSMATGKRSDLALLDRDPTAVHPEELKSTRTLMTIARGEVAWEGW